MRTVLPLEQQYIRLSFPTVRLAVIFFSANVSSLSVRSFELSTWRHFWTTASFDKSSTKLTSRASSFGPISVASEALSPLHFGGMMGYNYFKQIHHKIVNLLPRSKDVTPRQPFWKVHLGNLSREDRSVKIACQVSRITCFRQTCDLIDLINMLNIIKNYYAFVQVSLLHRRVCFYIITIYFSYINML